MKVLISAVIAVLAAQTALAEQKANKPFNTVNGRTTTDAPAGPRVFAVTAPGGGAAANTPDAGQAPAVTNAMINGAPSDGGRAFIGGGRQAPARNATGRAVHRGGKPFRAGGGRKVDGDGAPAPTPGTEEAPPNFTKPGALIRTTGQLPKYEKAEEARTHTTDAGEIVMSRRKALDVGRAPSVQIGPKDTLPPPNPGTGGSGGYSGGAAANTGATSTGSGGGKDNNGNGNNVKGTDSYDEKGAEKDPTGFNDAY